MAVGPVDPGVKVSVHRVAGPFSTTAVPVGTPFWLVPVTLTVNVTNISFAKVTGEPFTARATVGLGSVVGPVVAPSTVRL